MMSLFATGVADGKPTIAVLRPLDGMTTACVTALSADGSVIAGDCTDASGNIRACRWTNPSAPQDIGAFGPHATARGISADGSVIVGSTGDVAKGMIAYRWKLGQGMQDLGAGVNSNAVGVSDDGGFVAGSYGSGRVFSWLNSTPAHLELLENQSDTVQILPIAVRDVYPFTKVVGYEQRSNGDGYIDVWGVGASEILDPGQLVFLPDPSRLQVTSANSGLVLVGWFFPESL